MNTPTIERASHILCAALHMDDIHPAGIEIHLPFDAWWRLWNRVMARHPLHTTQFDGRGPLPEKFSYMGIVYKVKAQQQ